MKHYASITVIGRDKTGVVARVTSFLFERKANIEALDEQVTRGQFSMAIQASWKAKDFDGKTLAHGLQALGKSLGMEIRIRRLTDRSRQRFALMVTKEPGCPKAILSGVKSGAIRAEPAVVIGNHMDLASIAGKHRVPFVQVNWENRAQAEGQVLQLLEEYSVDFVILARFMKILSPNFVWRYRNKIINIHPSLLPSFPGPQAYRQAYERGVKIVGVTAHFVTMHLDEGPIIAQGAFPVRPGMSLKQIMERGQREEAKTLVRGVQSYLRNRLDVHWGIVREV
ncbi:MAG: formyltetrahydrofolate deformylase [Verrucomicrobia bacterium]|nr:formyltetrahydrofolate deformylase [Verrucomicrobiota bacterium]